MTDISAGPITLTGKFTGNFHSYASGTIEMYYRSGSYVGHESNSTGWTLLGTAAVSSLGDNIPTPFDVGNSLVVASGSTIGMFMYLNPYPNVYATVRYTDGNATYSDAFVRLDLGIAKVIYDPTWDPFLGDTMSPRIWNGSIDYQPVPLPGAVWLLGSGLLGLLGLRKKIG